MVLEKTLESPLDSKEIKSVNPKGYHSVYEPQLPICPFIHLSAGGHLGCFHVLAIINSASMNIGIHMSLSDLVSSVCMPRSGIAGSYGSSISSF